MRRGWHPHYTNEQGQLLQKIHTGPEPGAVCVLRQFLEQTVVLCHLLVRVHAQGGGRA